MKVTTSWEMQSVLNPWEQKAITTASDWPLPNGSLIEGHDMNGVIAFQREGGPIIRLNREYMEQRSACCRRIWGVILCGPVGLRVLKDSPERNYFLCRVSVSWSVLAALIYGLRLRMEQLLLKANVLDGYPGKQYGLLRWGNASFKYTPHWWMRSLKTWWRETRNLRRAYLRRWRTMPQAMLCSLRHRHLWEQPDMPDWLTRKDHVYYICSRCHTHWTTKCGDERGGAWKWVV